MKSKKKPVLLRKGYIVSLLVVAPLIIWNIFCNPDARELIGLSDKPAFSLGSAFKGGKKQKGGSAPARARQVNLSKAELEAFAASFTQREVEIFVLPSEDEKPDEHNEKNPETEAVARKKKLASLWEVLVSGTFPDLEHNWRAIINQQYCGVGRRIMSNNENLCAYQILGVGKYCVWMQSFDPKGVPDDIHRIKWPDVTFIATDRISGKLVPARVRFASGAEVRQGGGFRIASLPDIKFTVVRIWEHGACFEVIKDGEYYYYGCMVVAP